MVDESTSRGSAATSTSIRDSLRKLRDDVVLGGLRAAEADAQPRP